MTLRNLGRLSWSGGREKDMHRTYKVAFLVESTDELDGPQAVTFASGLPTIGASWAYGNDSDPYALCWPTLDIKPVLIKEPNFHWELEYTFTTRPFECCATSAITNPLSIPPQVSISFVNYQKRVQEDRNGKAVMSSSLEPVFLQKDANRPTVQIVQNLATLSLSQTSQMIDTVNDATLWGMPKRCVKLRNAPIKRMVYGTCTFYYNRTLEFDCRYESFDEKELRDQGHRWIDPQKLADNPGLDRTDPENFVRACDSRGNVHKIVLLDGNGEMCEDPVNHKHYLPTVELYDESNFLTLGIPATL